MPNPRPAPWPDDPATFVTARQVAVRLGHVDQAGRPDMASFYRAKRWREAHGFPAQPLPRRWRARAIDAWLAQREAGAHAPTPPANDTAPADDTDARARLALLAARTARKG